MICRKVKHSTVKLARRALLDMKASPYVKKANKARLHWYYCKECGCYHIGKTYREVTATGALNDAVNRPAPAAAFSNPDRPRLHYRPLAPPTA